MVGDGDADDSVPVVREMLAFSGLELSENGRCVDVRTATTLSQAEAAAGALRKALVDRKVHGDVLKSCRAELVADATPIRLR